MDKEKNKLKIVLTWNRNRLLKHEEFYQYLYLSNTIGGED